MTDWKIVYSSAETQPKELDTTSSQTTIYERRNIHQVTKVDPDTEREYKEWEFEERTYSTKEYKDLNSPVTQLLMQNLSDLEANMLDLLLQEG